MMTPTRMPSDKELAKFFRGRTREFVDVGEQGKIPFPENYTKGALTALKKSPTLAVAHYWHEVGRYGISAATFTGIFGEDNIKKVLKKLKASPYLTYGYCGSTDLPVFFGNIYERWEDGTMELDKKGRERDDQRNYVEKVMLNYFEEHAPTQENCRTYGGHSIPKDTWAAMKRLVKLYACK